MEDFIKSPLTVKAQDKRDRLATRVSELESSLSVEKAMNLVLMIRLLEALERIGANDDESIVERERLAHDINLEVSK